jgi:hypothetical protein
MNVWLTTYQHAMAFISTGCVESKCNVTSRYNPVSSNSYRRISTKQGTFNARLLTATVLNDIQFYGMMAEEQVLFTLDSEHRETNLTLNFAEINDANEVFSSNYSGCLGIKPPASLAEENRNQSFMY